MKTTALLSVALLLAGLLAPGRAHANSYPAPLPTVLEEDGRFDTLVAALQRAGLDDALRSGGPFTIFSPTDEAFGRLPEGTVEALLEPAQRERLRAVLTYHVVVGRVPASAILKTTSAKSLSGETLPIGLRVGGANVVEADLPAANGVIHVIDAVLLPPAAPAERSHDVMAVIEDAIRRGAPLFNAGDHQACADIYVAAARRLLDSGNALPEMDRMDLAAAHAAPAHSAGDRAWNLRHAFDRIAANQSFEPRMEASLPKGFPAPGPVGRVVEKTYPRYRAARADGRGSFWTLFRHIKKNGVEMTSPVEMTMDDSMREKDMAFLYERPDQGAAGTQNQVEVLDLEPVTVLSVGVRGPRSQEMVERARKAIEARLAESGDYERAGDWRMMGYNSPMVPAEQRFWELQLPVTHSE